MKSLKLLKSIFTLSLLLPIAVSAEVKQNGGTTGVPTSMKDTNITDNKTDDTRIDEERSRSEIGDYMKLQGANDLTQQYDGMLGRGRVRSMILHYNYSDPQGEERYPELTNPESFEERSLANVINVGAWDEVNKASMAIYRPYYTQQTDIANDEYGSDQFLDKLKSFNGVRISTLSYLDRTVMASAATTQTLTNGQQQIQELQKISRDMARLAHPEHALLYQDTDAKIEDCLLKNGNIKTAGAKKAAAKSGPCGPAPKKGGIYEYCLCLAETNHQVTSATINGKKASDHYSLIERVIYGSQKIKASGKAKDSQEKVDAFYDAAVALYGDVVLQGDGNQITQLYQSPALSITQKIDRVENGCESYQTMPSENVTCPISGKSITVKKGIQPALIELLRAWRSPDRSKMTEDEFKQKILPLWVEASLGYVLIADDIESILRMNGNPIETGPEWEPTGEGKRWIQGFADVSAVAAFSRFHVRMQSLMYDHLALNQTLKPHEREYAERLMQRVSAQLALAEADSRASRDAATQLLELANFSSRQEISDIALNSDALRARLRMQDDIASTSNFTGGMNGTCPLGNCEVSQKFDASVGSAFGGTSGVVGQAAGAVANAGRYSTGPISGLTSQTAGGSLGGIVGDAAQGAGSSAVSDGLNVIQQRLNNPG